MSDTVEAEIRPFQVGFPEAELTELRRRINATRWPGRDLAAFAIDHGDGTGQPGLIGRVLQGDLPGDLTGADILDNITLLLVDEHRGLRGPSLLGEQGVVLRRQGHLDPVRHQRVPRRALPSPAELRRARLPHNLIHYNTLDRGGHFAAWEQPQLLAEELREAFRPLRNAGATS